MIESDPLSFAQVTIDAAAVLGQGPPADLPGAVPDFVTELHGSIREFFGGSVDRLGEAARSVTPGAGGHGPGR